MRVTGCVRVPAQAYLLIKKKEKADVVNISFVTSP